MLKKVLNEKPAEPRQILLPGTTNIVTVIPQASSSTVKADPELIASEEKLMSELQNSIDQTKGAISKKKVEIGRMVITI